MLKVDYGAAQESNLPSLGLPDLNGFEDRPGHRAHAAPLKRVSRLSGHKTDAAGSGTYSGRRRSSYCCEER